MADLPVKEAGRHRWCLPALVPLTNTQAAAVAAGAEFVADAEEIVVVPMVSCVDCNGEFTDMKMIQCPAPDMTQPTPEGTR